MNKTGKRIIIFVFILLMAALLGYGGYKLYNYIVKDITGRVKKGVSQGITKGIGNTINPLKWPKK